MYVKINYTNKIHPIFYKNLCNKQKRFWMPRNSALLVSIMQIGSSHIAMWYGKQRQKSHKRWLGSNLQDRTDCFRWAGNQWITQFLPAITSSTYIIFYYSIKNYKLNIYYYTGKGGALRIHWLLQIVSADLYSRGGGVQSWWAYVKFFFSST